MGGRLVLVLRNFSGRITTTQQLQCREKVYEQRTTPLGGLVVKYYLFMLNVYGDCCYM